MRRAKGNIMFFNDLDLHPDLIKAVARLGFKKPTEIQHRSIPIVVSGKDLMASAQTGTGKTAAFALPAIQNLLTSTAKKSKGPRVLVLTPTRELAMQVKDCIDQFTRFTNLSSGLVVGGMGYGPQTKMLRRGVDFLIATPGRLKDHMQQGAINFRNLEILVLDEADRMLDMGFIKDIRKIAESLPNDRQTLLFSATLEGNVLKIAKEMMNNPKQVSLTSNATRHRSITQRVHHADSAEHKHHLLTHQLSDQELTQALIFTKTKRGADKLAKKLSNQNYKCAAFHGNMSQAKRKRTVDMMKKGKFKYLVATDVAARGLDIDGISHVINFDMPMVAEDYIHRIGRTGRAGASGTAVSLVNRDDRGKLRDIERLTGQTIKFDIVVGLEPSENPQTLCAFPPRLQRKPFHGKKKSKGRASNQSNGSGNRQHGKNSRRATARAAA